MTQTHQQPACTPEVIERSIEEDIGLIVSEVQCIKSLKWNSSKPMGSIQENGDF